MANPGEPEIRLIDLVMSISDFVDLVSPKLEDHHKKVAYIAYSIGREMGLSEEELIGLFVSGALHDIGAFSLKSRLDVLDFELRNPHHHAEIGYLLLKDFAPMTRVAEIIRCHHRPWLNGAGVELDGDSIPFHSHIIHLADRISVLISSKEEIFSQVDAICERININNNDLFNPELVEAFNSLADKEYFWLDVTSSSLDLIMNRIFKNIRFGFGMGGLLGIARLLRRTIDFRSRFTATHSVGVAAVAEYLAKYSGADCSKCENIRVAGWLHDIGKLAVPSEVLEKSGGLTPEDVNIMRKHTYYSYRALEHIESIREINEWISFHHENLDGSGYPFHLKGEQIPRSARIIAVADFFTAITEDRPYRVGMEEDQAMRLIRRKAQSGAFDPDIVSIFEMHFDEINDLRIEAQNEAVDEYQQFLIRMIEGAEIP